MKSVLLVIVLLAVSLGTAHAQDAKTVLERSIAYHDPEGSWRNDVIAMHVEVMYSEDLAAKRGHTTSVYDLLFDVSAGKFEYRKTQFGDVIEIRSTGDGVVATLNGSTEISTEAQEKHGLSLDDPAIYRDYYEYMLGMPMKLTDPGTIVEPTAARTTFQDRDVLSIRVTYAPDVGGDVWYYYFDPESYALVGCRFYHDEAKNDGEYLTFDGEVSDASGLRLPAMRAWYMNADDTYLATDKVVKLNVTRAK